MVLVFPQLRQVAVVAYPPIGLGSFGEWAAAKRKGAAGGSGARFGGGGQRFEGGRGKPLPLLQAIG